LEGNGNDGLDSRNYESIHCILDTDFPHLLDQILEILEAILPSLDLIHNGNDSALERIMTFPVGDRNYFSLVQLPVRLPYLAVRRDKEFCRFVGLLDSRMDVVELRITELLTGCESNNLFGG
jgi:hypothetical protein